MAIPKINERVLQLIDYYSNGNVKKFAESIEMSQQTVNRLFNIDKRTDKYPVVTTELLVSITEMYVDINTRWLLTGSGVMFSKQQNESANTISSLDSYTSEGKLLDIIKDKDAQIRELAKEVGRLEERLENSTKKSLDTMDVEAATCADAVG